MAIITQTVSDEYLRLIKGKTCKEAVQILKGRFERTGALGRLYACREFQSLKYNMRDNLATFVVKFDNCVERMETGNIVISEEEKITELLMAMPVEFNSVITAIETMAAKNSNITVEFVKNRLLNEEIKLKKRNTSNRGRDVAFITCYNCGKAGHVKRECRFRDDKRRRNNRESYEYNERRTTEGRSPGTSRDGHQWHKDRFNHPRRNDQNNSRRRARTAEADHDEEDVVTFCSEADAVCIIAENKGTLYLRLIRKSSHD